MDPAGSASVGDAAVDALYAATYRELRQLAHSRLRGGGRNTVLDTTAPPLLSGGFTDARLRRELRGDLDTIVLMAVKKTPRERYGTVDALADDIERHLSHREVLARGDTKAEDDGDRNRL
jgi:hypothetical protein